MSKRNPSPSQLGTHSPTRFPRRTVALALTLLASGAAAGDRAVKHAEVGKVFSPPAPKTIVAQPTAMPEGTKVSREAGPGDADAIAALRAEKATGLSPAEAQQGPLLEREAHEIRHDDPEVDEGFRQEKERKRSLPRE